jgi:rhodanese-related sulfurtransferase
MFAERSVGSNRSPENDAGWVAALRARGYLVRRLEDGYPEWKAAGLPIEAVA